MFRTVQMAMRISNRKNYYQILEVDPLASSGQIKSAYKELAKKYHPDINKGQEQQFKNINQAYQVLSDPSKKQQYDTSNQIHRSHQYSQESSKRYERTVDPKDEQTLEQLRRVQEEYLKKYMKFQSQRHFARNKSDYSAPQVQRMRRFHQAIHNRQYKTSRTPRNQDPNEKYNQEFDRSKDSLVGFLGDTVKGLWQAFKEIKGKK